MFAIKIENGQATKIDDLSALSQPLENGFYWLHLEGDLEQSGQLLNSLFNMDSSTSKVLCDELTRPRLFINSNDEAIATLRAVYYESENTMDMVSLRIWHSDHLVVTLSRVELPAITEVANQISRKAKWVTLPHHVIWRICDQVTDQVSTYLSELDESLDTLEEEWDSLHNLNIDDMRLIRLSISHVRRYLLPQMEALSKLGLNIAEKHLAKGEKRTYATYWKEVTNRMKRDIEATTELRERITILRDALQQSSNETTNRIMYLLSIVATFFLPLTFVASMLGMNVAGIPGHNNRWAFLIVCLLMAMAGLLQWFLFKRWRWLK